MYVMAGGKSEAVAPASIAWASYQSGGKRRIMDPGSFETPATHCQSRRQRVDPFAVIAFR